VPFWPLHLLVHQTNNSDDDDLIVLSDWIPLWR